MVFTANRLPPVAGRRRGKKRDGLCSVAVVRAKGLWTSPIEWGCEAIAQPRMRIELMQPRLEVGAPKPSGGARSVPIRDLPQPLLGRS